jgi:hypothetical protein
MAKLGAAVFLAVIGTAVAQGAFCKTDGRGSVYDFSQRLLDDSGPINLGEFQGKVLLIVNVASF